MSFGFRGAQVNDFSISYPRRRSKLLRFQDVVELDRADERPYFGQRHKRT